MNILLIGATGTGKTWVMRQLISQQASEFKAGLVRGVHDNNALFLGVYDGSLFEGSDKLSMSVAKDFDLLKVMLDAVGSSMVAEGDRFMNKKFIDMFSPTIIKITGDGAEGRLNRGSQQTDRQIKSIETRVKNIKADIEVRNSTEALKEIKKLLDKTHPTV